LSFPGTTFGTELPPPDLAPAVQTSPVSLSDGAHEGLAEGGHEFGDRNWLALGGPRFPVHADPEFPRPKRDPIKQNLKILATAMVLDRNSQVR
jgi:hypothetical protein